MTQTTCPNHILQDALGRLRLRRSRRQVVGSSDHLASKRRQIISTQHHYLPKAARVLYAAALINIITGLLRFRKVSCQVVG